MTRTTGLTLIALLAALAIATGCQKEYVDTSGGAPPQKPGMQSTPEDSPELTLDPVAEADGFKVPECVLPVGDGTVLISNIDSETEGYWEDDGAGYISLADAETLELIEERWVDGLNAPKGMCILDGTVWVSDNARMISISLDDPAQRETFEPEGAGQINDLATDGEIIYGSDTEQALIHRIKDGQLLDPIVAPESVNGITFRDGVMWAVSWDLHDVFLMDPTGETAPAPLGVAETFTNLDGIEVLDSGLLLVTDFMGNQVCTVDPDGLEVEKVCDIESPADQGIDEAAGVLYIPQFMVDKVVALPLP